MGVKASKYDIIREILCLVMLIGSSLYLILNWSAFPEQIPGHYNAAGEVDRWGKKSELLFVPIVVWIMYVFVSVLERFPMIWNTGITVTEENKDRIYRILKNLIGTMKLLVTGTFVCIEMFQAAAQALPGWFLPVSMGSLLGSMIYYIAKLVKNR